MHRRRPGLFPPMRPSGLHREVTPRTGFSLSFAKRRSADDWLPYIGRDRMKSLRFTLHEVGQTT